MVVLQTLMTWIIKIMMGRERMSSRQEMSTGKRKRAPRDIGSSIKWNIWKAKYCLKYTTVFLDFFFFLPFNIKNRNKKPWKFLPLSSTELVLYRWGIFSPVVSTENKWQYVHMGQTEYLFSYLNTPCILLRFQSHCWS